jgi:hypothetical protein
MPIFIGGGLRWTVDKLARRTDAESDSSPGVLLSSGYIAGGAIAGVVVAFFAFLPDATQKVINRGTDWIAMTQERIGVASDFAHGPDIVALAAFGVLLLALFVVGMGWLMGGKKADR